MTPSTVEAGQVYIVAHAPAITVDTVAEGVVTFHAGGSTRSETFPLDDFNKWIVRVSAKLAPGGSKPSA